ncbi:preprotein translocase subunit SecE [Streptococcus sp. DD12]|uniref:preprotein translocase subunit SecE n=1 Tax=Streptococcus sp. DD12 TaxID=1777880 RepID=UPI000792FD7F|nr:preprotein translocase subunit SecE [Streptococcus sp. DD12]KXT75495.1 Preprotein translocase subunit SecE [Streptococcus sp. DD12]
MRFIGGVFRVLSDTTWPDRKQRWHDFISILEYTAFFTVIIYAFDQLIEMGLLRVISLFSK